MRTLTEVLTAYEITRQMDRNDRGHEALTASSFGGCLRRAAFVKNNEPVSNTQPLTSVATVGSLLHDAVAALWEALGEDTAVTGQHGTSDVVQKDGTVRDLKTVSRGKFDYWASTGVPEEVWKQLHAYGADHGATAETVLVVDVLCRETGRTASYTMLFDPQFAADALTELEVTTEVIAKGVPPIPPERSGHGDPICSNCPFLDTCWGEKEEHPVFDGSDLEMFAAEYLEAQAAEKTAKERKELAKSRLRGADGAYGQMSVKWSDVKGGPVEFYRKPYRKLTVNRVS